MIMSELTTRGNVFNIQRYSIHDGPGIRTIVFLKGCPLRCRWCSNPESQEPNPALAFAKRKCISCGACEMACPLNAITYDSFSHPVIDRSICDICGQCVLACCTEALYFEGQSKSVAEVLDEVEKDRAFYDNSGGGLTLSGGEVLSQPNFAYDLLAAARHRGLHTAIETTGFAQPEVLLKIASQADLIDRFDQFSFLHFVTGSLPAENLERLQEEVDENVALLPLPERGGRQPLIPFFHIE